MNIFYPSKPFLYGDRKTMEQSATKISNSNTKTIHFRHVSSIPNKPAISILLSSTKKGGIG